MGFEVSTWGYQDIFSHKTEHVNLMCDQGLHAERKCILLKHSGFQKVSFMG
jgi:hypothetical protein